MKSRRKRPHGSKQPLWVVQSASKHSQQRTCSEWTAVNRTARNGIFAPLSTSEAFNARICAGSDESTSSKPKPVLFTKIFNVVGCFSAQLSYPMILILQCDPTNKPIYRQAPLSPRCVSVEQFRETARTATAAAQPQTHNRRLNDMIDYRHYVT